MSLGDITHVRKSRCHPHTCNPSTEGLVGAETGGMLGLAGHPPGVSETPSQRKREKSDRAGHLMSPSSLLECASTVTCKVHAHPHTYAYMHMRIHTHTHARTCACTTITHRETRFFLTFSYWLWSRYHGHVPAFSTGIILLSPKKLPLSLLHDSHSAFLLSICNRLRRK